MQVDPATDYKAFDEPRKRSDGLRRVSGCENRDSGGKVHHSNRINSLFG